MRSIRGVVAAAWFWADRDLDTGSICAQELVILDPAESPGRSYHMRFAPAGLRALLSISAGSPSRIQQDKNLSAYDGKFPPRNN